MASPKSIVRHLAAAWLAASIASSSTARAEDQAGNGDAFAAGLARFDAGDFVGAAAAWEPLVEGNASGTSWRVLYNLGLAHRNAGRLDLALDRFQQFLARVGAEATALDAPLEERRQDAAEQVALLRPQVGKVDVPAVGGATRITIDDRAPRAAGFTTHVMPGRHVVVIGEGKDARRSTFDVAAGATHTIDAAPVRATDVVVPTPPVPPPPPPRDDGASIAFAVLGGATALSFALPIGLAVHAGDIGNAAESLGRGHTSYPDAVESYEDARTGYYVSYVLPGVLGAATIAAFAFVVSGASEGSARTAIVVRANATDVGVVLRCEL